jgi:hypothetical protein
MNKITIILLFLISICSFGQNAKDSLKSKIINSDRIEIVSHDDLYIVKGKPGKDKSYWTKIVNNGKPNKSIIKERIKLDKTSKNELLSILINEHTDTFPLESAYSFFPNHSILIYKDSKCSFVEICFGCRNYAISEDVIIDKNILTTEKDWKTLEHFFRINNIKYKMPK